jgi:hypothetical protein
VISGKGQEQKANFGMMQNKEVKSNLSNKLGMNSMNFSILNKQQTNKVFLEMIQKGLILDKN